MDSEQFNDAIDSVIADAQNTNLSMDEIISVLELKLMALKEEQE